MYRLFQHCTFQGFKLRKLYFYVLLVVYNVYTYHNSYKNKNQWMSHALIYLKERKEIVGTIYMYEMSKVLEPRANLRGTSTRIQKRTNNLLPTHDK